jgi:hypothetical protein
MNFDQLKEAWANDPSKDVSVPVNNLPVKKNSYVVTRIRRNMKKEFIVLLMIYLVIIIFVLLFSRSSLSLMAAGIVSFILLVQSGYYFSRFYSFYRKMSRYDLSLKKSIRKIIYELELNMEIYKTYSFCSMPLVIIAGFFIISPNNMDGLLRQWGSMEASVAAGPLALAIGILLLFQVAAALLANLYMNLQYGQYLKELKKVMDDLDTEE